MVMVELDKWIFALTLCLTFYVSPVRPTQLTLVKIRVHETLKVRAKFAFAGTQIQFRSTVSGCRL